MTPLEISLLVLIAVVLLIVGYMLREIFKWDKITLTGKNLLLSFASIVVLILLIGKLVVIGIITILLEIIFMPIMIVLSIIAAIVGIFYFGKIIRQM